MVTIIQNAKRFDSTIIGNLNNDHNQLIRKIEPKIATCCTVKEALLTNFFFLTGMLPYMPINYESLAAPYPTKAYINMKLTSASKAESL